MSRGARELGGNEIRDTLVEAYAVNEEVNQLLLEHLDPRAWREKPVGRNSRTIAAIFTHMHNVRRKWLRLSAPHLGLPKELNRMGCTRQQARAALAKSASLCGEMLAQALEPEARVKHFVRDGWTRPWPGGAAMFAYNDFARCASPRPNLPARAPIGLSAAGRGDVRDVVLGETVEAVRLWTATVNEDLSVRRTDE
jgi:hypothetical protein